MKMGPFITYPICVIFSKFLKCLFTVCIVQVRIFSIHTYIIIIMIYVDSGEEVRFTRCNDSGV